MGFIESVTKNLIDLKPLNSSVYTSSQVAKVQINVTKCQPEGSAHKSTVNSSIERWWDLLMGIVCIRSVCNVVLNLPESSISVCSSVFASSA